jgi:hypothetical protein
MRTIALTVRFTVVGVTKLKRDLPSYSTPVPAGLFV